MAENDTDPSKGATDRLVYNLFEKPNPEKKWHPVTLVILAICTFLFIIAMGVGYNS